MDELCLKSMADDRLLERAALAKRSNELTAELLAYLGEVDARGLHLGQACSSLFVFCVERLHMSESAAGKRITAARVARRFPVALEMIASGDIVAELAPRPDLPSRVVALPQCAAAQAVHAPERVEPAPARVEAKRPAVVAPLSPRRYEIRVTVEQETHDRLRQLQDLLPVSARDPAAIVSRALELLLERTLAKKAAVTERPRERKASQKRTRHIPAAVRRAVWQRDTGRCAFLDDSGRRCSATRALQFHHVNNYGRGAPHEPSEIELRCPAHNQYQAVLDYGAAFMAAKKSSSRAEEPRRLYRRGRGRGASERPDAGPRPPQRWCSRSRGPGAAINRPGE